MNESWPFWRRYLNLAQPRLGADVVSVTDDFFGAAARLIRPEEPVFIPGKYDEHGKWMDGWESRRRRDGGHDSCVVRLGGPARVHGVDIDTRFFDGNQPLAATIEAASESDPERADWFELLPRAELGPNAQHRLAVVGVRTVRLLRLHIFPDGGVARLRVFGEVQPPSEAFADESVDLAAVENGGSVVCASDEHFGAAAKLLLPGRGLDMGDGWETRRRRGPGFDWAILTLGRAGTIERVVLDTAHFKGNFPHQASLQGALVTASRESLVAGSASWPELLPQQFLRANIEHEYVQELKAQGPISHLRLNIFPDGGVSRLRAFGRATQER
ncbi:MAG: allantoicase [Thermoanaerobaculia bacterium]